MAPVTVYERQGVEPGRDILLNINTFGRIAKSPRCWLVGFLSDPFQAVDGLSAHQ